MIPGSPHWRTTDEGTDAPPRTWILLGDKAGDNGQVRTIEDALDWKCEHKHVQVLDKFVFGKPRVGPTLYHVDREHSDPLEPPWPDLILTIGRRPANAALWVRQQSGGRTRIVLVGKPSGMMSAFDLIVASAENQFPPLPNVLPIALPLMRIDGAAVDAAAREWSERLSRLPRPLTALLVGGPTGPFAYTRRVARRLIALAREVIEQQGGTPFITTSRRTPEHVVNALEQGLPAAAQLFKWGSEEAPNPYRGLLGLADAFIVTGDSISMITEVARLRRPLAILPLPTGPLGALDQWRRAAARHLFRPVDGTRTARLRGTAAQWVYRSGLITHTRDFRAFHRMLVDRGLAVPAGGAVPPPTGPVPDDAGLVIRRIKALFD